MRIREMEEKDRQAVLELMIPFYASEAVQVKAPEEVLRRDIEDCLGDCPYIEGFVMEEGEKIAGYSMTAKSYSTEYGGVCVWIEDLCLAPEYRGRGYGSTMLQYVEDRFRDKAVRLRLEVEPENRQAVAAYRKFGFHDLPYGQMTKEYPKLKEPR